MPHQATWEYLYLWTGAELTGHKLLVRPAHKVDLTWLTQRHPNVIMEMDAKRQSIIIHYSTEQDHNVDCAIIDFLGSRRWEPFSVSEGAMHFKRRIDPEAPPESPEPATHDSTKKFNL